MSDGPVGPDPETLRRLHEQLPDFVEHEEEKRIFAGQKPVSKSRAHKCCKVCGKLFDYRIIENTVLPDLAVCSKCQKELDNGWIALVSANYFAFIKSASLKDWAGTIRENVSPEVMQKLQDMFALEWHVKDETKPDLN